MFYGDNRVRGEKIRKTKCGAVAKSTGSGT